MTLQDPFELRAASAGAALRAAFLDDPSVTATHDRPATVTLEPAVPARVTDRTRRPRGALTAAAALVVGAVSVGVFALGSPDDGPADVLTPPPGPRETAVLVPPYLVGAGSLPDRPVQSVQDVPVPFTFRTPPEVPGTRRWQYSMAGGLFDLGNIVSGMTVLAPTGTYDPEVPWQGQDELVPAPTDADGWAAWLDATGLVEVTERRELSIGGAPATRFSLDLADLPAAYEGCGGGRTCLALVPMQDPQVGPARVGTGPQAGIDDETPELTVVELEDRAVVVLTSGDPDRADAWLPTVRAVVDSLRFT